MENETKNEIKKDVNIFLSEYIPGGETDLKKAVSDLIVNARKSAALTQRDIAERMQTNVRTVYNAETGTQNMRMSRLHEIMQALGMRFVFRFEEM